MMPLRRFQVIFAFAAIYTIWGSTYLAIRYAISSLPPWGLSSSRFFLAAFLMWLIAKYRKEKSLNIEEKKVAASSGALLVIANATVGVMEQWVPSGIAAVVIGAMPIWIMFLGWIFFAQKKPSLQKVAGALIGLAGIYLIVSGDLHPGQTWLEKYGAVVLIFSSWLWAAGTLLQRKLPPLKSNFLFSSWQMLSGAITAGIVCLIFEKPWDYPWSQVSSLSLYALSYLVIFGSVIAFTAYGWLSRNVEPHLVSTYALVNPLIAVGLGWFFLSEPVNSKILLATALVLLGLSLLILKRRKTST